MGIVFEDVTDGRPRASARWQRLANGKADATCGGVRHDGTAEPLFENPSEHPDGLDEYEEVDGFSMVFSGDHERYAMTPPLDVSKGGYISFGFRYGYGAGDNGLGKYPLCRRVERATAVTRLYYSTDFGGNWFEIEAYRYLYSHLKPGCF